MTPNKAFFNLDPVRQKQILDTAVALYANHPYEAVTVRMLCREMDININTFYRYFDSKDDMYIFLYRWLMEQNDIPPETVWTIEDYIFSAEQEAAFYTPTEIRFFQNWQVLPDHILQRLIFDGYINYEALTRISIERGMASGTLRADLDADFVSYLINTSPYLLMRYAKDRGIDDMDTFQRLKRYMIYEFFNYGLRGRKADE